MHDSDIFIGRLDVERGGQVMNGSRDFEQVRVMDQPSGSITFTSIPSDAAYLDLIGLVPGPYAGVVLTDAAATILQEEHETLRAPERTMYRIILSWSSAVTLAPEHANVFPVGTLFDLYVR